MKNKIIILSFLLCLTITAGSKNLSKESINNNKIPDAINYKQYTDEIKDYHFTPSASKLQDLNINAFSNKKEFKTRRGLPNFFRKCSQGKSVTIGYIGGSVTASGRLYRLQSANYLAYMFPECKMKGINAASGGTGSDFGACRTNTVLLNQNPDLVIIEYAVNGANPYGVEGIIRKTIKHNPKTDILMVYTIRRGQGMEYANGNVPKNIQTLDKVAAYYDIPSVHMGLQVGLLEKAGKLLFTAPKSYKGDKIPFSPDGVHPNEVGGNLYACACARAFESMKNNTSNTPFILPEPFLEKQLGDAQMIDPCVFNVEKKGWKRVNCQTGDVKYVRCEEMFDYFYDGDKNSKPIKFTFEGSMIGVMDIGAPDAGALDIIVDGKKIVVTKYSGGHKVISTKFVDAEDPQCSTNRFFDRCYEMRHKDYAIMPIKYGVHDVEISVNKQKIDKAKILNVSDAELAKRCEEFKPQVVHLGYVLINGKLINVK